MTHPFMSYSYSLIQYKYYTNTVIVFLENAFLTLLLLGNAVCLRDCNSGVSQFLLMWCSFPRTDVVFSPDDQLIVTGVSRGKEDKYGKLVFLHRETLQQAYMMQPSESVSPPEKVALS